MRYSIRHKTPSRQKGATLIIALLVLILIMMIGITTVSTSSTQFKLAGNLQFEDSAMNNAETAATTAERWLATNFNDPGFTTRNTSTSGQLYPKPITGAQPIDPITLDWSDNTQSTSVAGNTAQRYLIQLLSTNNMLLGSSQSVGGRKSATCGTVNTYQISARGTSARGSTKFVQTFYSVLNC